MTTTSIILQALLEAGAAGVIILLALGGLEIMPARFRHVVNRAFARWRF